MTSERPLKTICHCIISGGFGGIERQVASMVAEQRKRYTVRVLTAFTGGVFTEKMSRNGVAVDSLNLKSGMDINPGKIYSAWRIFRSCDLLHIHSFNPVFFLAALLSRRKIVFTFHGITENRRRQTWSERVAQKMLSISIHSFVHKITAVSEFMREIIQNTFHYKKPIYVTYNIAPRIPEVREQADEIRRTLGLDKDHFVVLHFGRMVAEKGGDRLLQALALTRQHDNIRALFIGNGPHLNHLMESAKELDVQHAVTFIDFRENIHDYVRMADIVALPSWNEPFGIVALEALSLGKAPLIYKDGGGLLEIVAPLKGYKLVVDSEEQMAERIVEYSQHPELLEKLASAGRARAEEFNAANAIETLDRIYFDRDNESA